LSYVSERLCDLAKDLRCPIVVLCQLRRPPTDKKDKRPQLEDMKESGDLEANADVVLGLYRADKAATSMEVSCLKNRDGAAGWTAYLDFEPQLQVFKDGVEPSVKPYVEQGV
jgi:replicative DNA helicase